MIVFIHHKQPKILEFGIYIFSCACACACYDLHEKLHQLLFVSFCQFGIEDLKNEPEQTACWDGVRNYQVFIVIYIVLNDIR